VKQKKRFGWLFALLRYGLLAVAVVYLYFNVKWYDYVTLSDAAHTRVRVIDQTYSPSGQRTGLVVLRDGQATPIGLDGVQCIKDTHIPAIQFGIRSVVQQMKVGYALLALLMFGPAWLLMSQRLVCMLAVQDVRLRYWSAVKLTYVGNFFNFALPGTTGGDLLKAYYLTAYTHRKTEAVTAVFLDRIMGLLGNILIASTMILIKWNVVGASLGWAALLPGAVGALLVLAAIAIFNPRIRAVLHLRQIVDRLPASGQLLRVGRAVVAMGNHKRHVAVALLLTLALQGLCYVSAFVGSRALGMDGSLLHYLIFIPIGFLIAAIPITPQGFGVMEGAFILFFTGGGLTNSDSQAFALALALRLTQLLWALPGGLVPLLGAHVPRAAELEAFEENGTVAVPEVAPARSEPLT
jgi:glycosyltransferase 2 family protein